MLIEIFDPKARPRPLGIDLGTTNSLVAVVKDGHPLCITDCNGKALVPSVVYFGKEGTIVGESAKDLAALHPADTIVSVKRFMGRGADDQETRRLGPYVFAPAEEAPNRRMVTFKLHAETNHPDYVTPVEVSAEILRALRELAKDELRNVGPVVITVPAYFDDAQRQATKDAGKLAGLEVLRLLNEPTAAALAYGLHKKTDGTFLVYDLGGGTFDVTVLKLDNGVFQTLATGGDSALGGDDFDRAIAAHLIEQVLKRTIDTLSKSEIRESLTCARLLKHQLTDGPQGKGTLFNTEVTLDLLTMNQCIKPIVDRTIVPMRRALRDANITVDKLDGVILIGGSTRVRIVRDTVRSLTSKEPLAEVDPDQVVALGAAIQADLLAGSELQQAGEDLLLLDVVPLSLGVETMGGIVDRVIPRNTTIPTGAKSTFTTYTDNQTGFEIHVVQGERDMASDCRSLAKFTLRGIPPLPAGMARLEVTFRVDADGLLKVHARETLTGIEQSVQVKPSYGLSEEEMEDMLIDALDHGEDDIERRKLAEVRVEAERVLLATQNALRQDMHLLQTGEAQTIELAIQTLKSALLGNRANLIRSELETLERVTTPLAARRMNAAIAKAIEGKSLAQVETTVSHARGVDSHVQEHTANRTP